MKRAARRDDGNLNRRPDVRNQIPDGNVRPQMAAGLFALDDDGRRAETLGYFCKLNGGHNRHDRRPRFFSKSKHITGEARARHDEVDSFVDRRLDDFAEFLRRNHNIYADDALRKGTRHSDFIPKLIIRHAGSRNQAYSALVGHRRGKPRRRQADRHAALHDRNFCCPTANLQFWKFQT